MNGRFGFFGPALVAVACMMALVSGCDNRTVGPRDSGMVVVPPPMDGGQTCTNECNAGDPPRCAGAGFQSCTSVGGCLRWSEITSCPADTTCSGAGVCMGTGCPGGCCPSCDGTRCGAGSDGCGGECSCGSGQACSDANTCCTPENGAASCNRMLTQWCARIVQCCTAAGPDVCVDWAYDNTQCRANFLSQGFDCSASEWTSSAFCAEGINVCVNDMRLVACADITGGTANVPGSCP